MNEVDLHSHSSFSNCGIHTIIEILEGAKRKGLKAQAITDHGPAKVAFVRSTFFNRLTQPVEGITLLKGMECNIMGMDGGIDLAPKFIRHCDVLLAGLHDNLDVNWDRDEATTALINTMKNNPWIDVITHPLNHDFEVDLRRVAQAAGETGTALEFNNSKIVYGSVSEEEQCDFIRICMEEGCLVAVNTDAHTLNELGDTEAMDRLLEKEGFPEERIVNRNYEILMEWLDGRRAAKQAV